MMPKKIDKKKTNENIKREAILIINRYEDIIKKQNKKVIGSISKKGELLKKF